MRLDAMAAKAMELGASDIHIVTGLPLSMRVAGEIMSLDGEALDERGAEELVMGMLSEEQRAQLAREQRLCFSTVLEGVAHVRISVYTRLGRPEAAIRLRPLGLMTIEELGLPPAAAELTRKPNGLVLITGPTGVGKTTTLYSMIDRINTERRARIVTIEDPIEFLHTHKRSIVVQQELGRDARTFNDALMHFLRLDPDIICIGEVRDGETVAAALLAAETGHLVIATLHTTSAAQTVERILTAIPPDRRAGAAVQLSHCLRGVVTQQLLPTADTRSRVLAYEIMLANPAVRNCIREGKLTALQDVIQSGAAEGMRTLDTCLRELHQRGRISYDTAVTYARDPRNILSLAGKVL